MKIILRIMTYLKPYWRRVAVMYLALAVALGMQLIIPAVLERAIDRGIVGRDRGYLVWAALAIVGLAALQGVGLIHGDLKPSNVFVGRAGTVTLIDLGFARRPRPEERTGVYYTRAALLDAYELLRQLSASGVTVLLSTHNINLAARYADRLVLLSEGRVAAAGAPSEVLEKERVEQVYKWPVEVVPFTGTGPDAGAPQVIPLSGNR